MDYPDLSILKHCLWNNPENLETIDRMISDIIKRNKSRKEDWEEDDNRWDKGKTGRGYKPRNIEDIKRRKEIDLLEMSREGMWKGRQKVIFKLYF